MDAVERPKMVWWQKLLAAAVAVFVLLLIIGALTPRETYLDVANRQAEQCIDAGGDDGWNPADGNLRDYCTLKARVSVLQQKARDDGRAAAQQ